ncbi:hypothetical protein [Lihuaxuella thermophila]|uniref:Uncharacterized protein n=1 Tax=Lihuaxuella thermophila TaxID=1173111 RepID=A0A1H8IG71_9BACL|nr:hypothetical protein [Lihuaxuella thermophila]SEN67269.1 hypothetical protein SAMN05444955_11764 [Lihuaxuella thermophila]
MNKKKLGIFALSLGVSASVLLTSALSVKAGNASGYDQYKAALKQTKAVENLTGNLDLSIQDNGKKLFTVDSTIRRDLKNHAGNGKINIEANGKKQTLEVYHQENKKIMKASNSEIYYVMNEKEKKVHHKSGDRAQKAEFVIDALMSGLRNDIQSVNRTDGSKEVSLNLSEGQISPVVQALVSILVQNAAGHEPDRGHHGAPFFKGELKPDLPELTRDIKIKQVNIKAEINKENRIEEQTAQVLVTGKDAAGKEHQLTIRIRLDLSQFNHTVMDKVDLTGKKVKTFEPKARQDW